MPNSVSWIIDTVDVSNEKWTWQINNLIFMIFIWIFTRKQMSTILRIRLNLREFTKFQKTKHVSYTSIILGSLLIVGWDLPTKKNLLCCHLLRHELHLTSAADYRWFSTNKKVSFKNRWSSTLLITRRKRTMCPMIAFD